MSSNSDYNDDDDDGEIASEDEVATTAVVKQKKSEPTTKPGLQSRYDELIECPTCTDSSIVDGCILCSTRHGMVAYN
jgi:hypothetical protein